MRHLNFRAWDTSKKQMIYKFMLGSTTDDNNNMWTCPATLSDSGEWVNNDNLIITQNTGVYLDKKSLWEGDILADKDYLYIIKYIRGSFILTNLDEAYSLDDVDYMEVIGNIFEHSSLLNKEMINVDFNS